MWWGWDEKEAREEMDEFFAEKDFSEYTGEDWDDLAEEFELIVMMLDKGSKSGKFQDQHWNHDQSNGKMKFGKLYDEALMSQKESDRGRRGKGGKGFDGRGKDRDDVVEAAIASSLISILVTSAVFIGCFWYCKRRNRKMLSATAELAGIGNVDTRGTPQRNENSADF